MGRDALQSLQISFNRTEKTKTAALLAQPYRFKINDAATLLLSLAGNIISRLLYQKIVDKFVGSQVICTAIYQRRKLGWPLRLKALERPDMYSQAGA